VGVAGSLAGDGSDVPALFVAVTVNVYATALVRPSTSQETAGAVTVHVSPVFAVTKYDSAAPPPPATGVTVTFVSPATTVGANGVPGAAGAVGVALALAREAADVPELFVAVTVKV
jgi:hypothetical protein